jgi:hypothetical protein
MQRVARLFVLAMATACGVGVDLGGGLDAGRDTGGSGGTCPSFLAPTATAACEGCSKGSTSCQPNGCFNGYFCDVEDGGFTDCKAPGTACSMGKKFDAH